MVKTYFFLVLISLLRLTGCAPSVSRKGYAFSSPGAPDCKPVIKRFAQLDSSSLKKIGSVKIGDSGFTTQCEESDILQLLNDEACAAGADVINITAETRADLLSTCYRVEADFLKITAPSETATLKSDEEYDADAVNDRTILDKDRKTGMVVGQVVGTIVGTLVGIWLASMLF